MNREQLLVTNDNNSMNNEQLKNIVSHFHVQGEVKSINPLGNGLINDTFKVETVAAETPDYVLQRINNAIFTDVEQLQRNIQLVTTHIRKKLETQGVEDLGRRVLNFIEADNGKTYWKDEEDKYWRISTFIPDALTFETVNTEYSYAAGLAFGEFEAALVDLPADLGETIPDFHNMEFRMKQLHEAVENNAVNRVEEVKDLLKEIEDNAAEICKAEQLHREGKLPKRICHCDTKVNNMMFDKEGNILCVIDLDTVMPSYIFSDYGDFLRTAANFTAEDDPDMSKVGFNEKIFQAFTKGYLKSASSFLQPIEIENLPYAVALFPFMQCVRFLADYINGDVYFKTKYATHNLDRANNQMELFKSVCKHSESMKAFIQECINNK